VKASAAESNKKWADGVVVANMCAKDLVAAHERQGRPARLLRPRGVLGSHSQVRVSRRDAGEDRACRGLHAYRRPGNAP
jgi:hypothetical protein